MIFNHHRFQIWNQNQHPFKHNMSDFGYSNPNLPGITDMQGALDYLCAVIYPNAKAAVPTYGDLPLVGNVIGDYRVVNDDGDGRSAGYRWEQREGEAVASWHKIYDVDWSTDSILASWENKTLDLYVLKTGHDDIDGTGTPITGLYAGQIIFGGKSANTNLTLSANSGDGVGPQTGFVQVTDTFRPVSDGLIALGESTKKWSKGWFLEGQFGTLNIKGGEITDTTGTIDFDTTSLVTSGDFIAGTTTVTSGFITDTTGEINFDNEDLRTTGDIFASSLTLTSALSLPSGTQIANFTFTNGNIACGSFTVDFNALNLTTTGVITGGTLRANNVEISSNSISPITANTSLNLYATGSGFVTLKTTGKVEGNLLVENGYLNVYGTGSYIQIDSMNLNGTTISTTGDMTLQPSTNVVSVVGSVIPSTDKNRDLGSSLLRFNKLYLFASIHNGVDEFLIGDLFSLRNAGYRDTGRTQAAQVGDALFWNGSQWLASSPDTEITHSSLSGLTTGDAGHTQFALLAGRAGGQSLVGGTASGENLNLESTSHATKGFIQAKDTVRPFSDAVYSAGWTGRDLGHVSYRWNDVYSAGEFKGFRAENVDTLPAASSQKKGRLYYYTVDESLYVDTSTALKQVGGNRVLVDTVWDGIVTTKDVTVSGLDARTALWQIKDNTNDFEVIYCTIKATSATNVRIIVGSPLPAGTYRLVGV